MQSYPSALGSGEVYEVMEGREYLIYPNGSGDASLHPNDQGHGVLALEFARALLGGAG